MSKNNDHSNPVDGLIPLLHDDQPHRHGNSEDNQRRHQERSTVLFNKQLQTDTYAYTTYWLTKLGITWDIDNTGYYPEEPTTFHLSKTFHNLYPLDWDGVDFKSVHDAGKWLDKRSKEVSKQEHLRKVSEDMGNHANSATVSEFLQLAAEYHITPKDKFTQGENDE